MSPEPTHRRSLVKAALAGGVAVGAIGVAVRIDPSSQPDDPTPGASLELSADSGSDVKSLEVPLDDTMLRRSSQARWTTRDLPTSVHSMVALTWLGESTADLSIRSKVGGRWGEWVVLPTLDDHPDAISDEATAVRGTHLRFVGAADGVQVRVAGSRPEALTLVLLHPAARASDQDELAEQVAGRATLARAGEPVPRPTIRTRKDWGATESWRDGSPTYNSTIAQMHVHHTASGNDYSRTQVPALLRGFYRYHTQNLGWSDIGYNFLVDKFGRIWEGRAGGVTRPVRGAHTLGFNTASTGVAAIGNYEVSAPSNAMIGALAKMAAWKLDQYGRRPRGKIKVRSEGSDKYRTGTVVALRVIDGHRDTNDTACPGKLLYARLPDVRSRAHKIVEQHRNVQKQVRTTRSPKVKGRTRPGRLLEVDPGAYEPAGAKTTIQWRRDGKAVPGATGRRYRCSDADLGSQISVLVRATSPGADAVQEVVGAGRVTTPVKIVAEARSRRGKVRVDARLVPPRGRDVTPTGTVTVKVSGRSKQVKLRDGRLRVSVGGRKPIKAGNRRVVITYPGDRACNPNQVELRVQVDERP
ncbi:N-acetylmuramoyl-L-alanine amidase [Nocardioides dokdonensis FR1436]|uniref:N-acetylmuramoyl-L-alanine amidase n=1 Tax=Nocardioides dokdonensis FR1436 TaxID=1300347 RepID=A0A1A9GSI1_9ACTN|nr:N-acetylmuramoyl-L-alanine amidase [Nocardioides dokdonensis]ANH40435.1 N-acetylmuramoyl-L-alanine amidase [Nocardioides dokdonensis FR1436]